MSGYTATSIAELTNEGGWAPIRSELDVRAFGINAWTRAAGEQLVSDHDEATAGHQEIYILLSGAATFTVSGEEVQAGAGSLIFVSDPSVRRAAVATADGTTVLVIGAKVGEAFQPRGWERIANALPYFGTGEYAEARRLLAESLEQHPDEPLIAYNLACAEARLGEREAALEHLTGAIRMWPDMVPWARDDEDLASLREEPGFIALTGDKASAR